MSKPQLNNVLLQVVLFREHLLHWEHFSANLALPSLPWGGGGSLQLLGRLTQHPHQPRVRRSVLQVDPGSRAACEPLLLWVPPLLLLLLPQRVPHLPGRLPKAGSSPPGTDQTKEKCEDKTSGGSKTGCWGQRDSEEEAVQGRPQHFQLQSQERSGISLQERLCRVQSLCCGQVLAGQKRTLQEDARRIYLWSAETV